MLRLGQRPGSPYWYIFGTIGGKQIYESTKTDNRDLAQERLDARQGHLYRKFFVEGGDSLPSIPQDMMRELVALASRSRNRSQKKKIGHGLDTEGVAALYISQRGKCAVSGIAFRLDGDGGHDRPFAPSIDRIDNAKGYSPDNVRLVCRIANFAMNTWGDKALLELALGVTSVWETVCAKSVRVHLKQFAREDKNMNEINEIGALVAHHAPQV
jgi:hypothetical protein